MSNMDNIIEIPCEESDGEFEKIPIELLPDKKINIRLLFTLYSIEEVNTYSQSAKVNFQIDFLFKKSDKLKYNFTLEDNKFPFVIINACGDYNIIREYRGEYKSNTLNKFNLYANKKLISNTAANEDDEDIIMFDSYHMIVEVKVVNHTNFIPFNNIYIPIHISTTGYHNTQFLYFTNSDETSFGEHWGNEDEKTTFGGLPFNDTIKGAYVRMMSVHNSVATGQIEQAAQYEEIMKIKDIMKKTDTVTAEKYDPKGFWWPRAYFIVKYNFTYKEDIFKYFIIPTLFNHILVIVSSLKKAEFLALFTTFCLSDIALLFTMPATKTLTISEISVMLEISVSLILVSTQWYTDPPLTYLFHFFTLISQLLLIFISKFHISKVKKSENNFWIKYIHPKSKIKIN
jgi:hypothetical protein